MPEGDTIHRAAATLQHALGGKVVRRFETVLPQLARVDEDAKVVGRTIEKIEAVGKHLLMHFSGDLHLRTHMRMNGTWHIYRVGERWKKRPSDMRLVVGTDDYVAVAFNVPVAEFHDSASLARQVDLRKIGPDFLGVTFDDEEALRRVRGRAGKPIAEVLLNQRVVAGVGNVYKSEVLFLEKIYPFTLTDSLSDEEIRRILITSRALMERNVVDGTVFQRKTTDTMRRDQPLWVYGRRGEPCRKCSTPIEYRRSGIDARSTYWCPRCQPVR